MGWVIPRAHTKSSHSCWIGRILQILSSFWKRSRINVARLSPLSKIDVAHAHSLQFMRQMRFKSPIACVPRVCSRHLIQDVKDVLSRRLAFQRLMKAYRDHCSGRRVRLVAFPCTVGYRVKRLFTDSGESC